MGTFYVVHSFAKNMSLTLTFGTKSLRMAILVSRSMLLRSRNPMGPFVMTFNLDLSRP